MKKKLILILAAVLVLAVGAGLFFWKLPFGGGEQQGLLKNAAGEETPFKLEILALDDIVSEYVREKVEELRHEGTADGKSIFYTVYHNNFDMPMEAYIFMPDAKDIMGDVSVKNFTAETAGAALMLKVSTKPNIKRKKPSTDLILHITAEDAKADVSMVVLTINGEKYECLKDFYTRLK